MHKNIIQGRTICFSLFFILHSCLFAQKYLGIDSIILPKGTHTNCLLYKNGKLYAGTDKGLYIVDSSSLNTDSYLTDYHINKMEQSEHIWMGTYENILVQFSSPSSYKEHKFCFDPKNHLVTSLYSKSYTQYIGTGLGSIFIRQKGNKYKEISTPVKSNVYCININKKNDIFIGTTNGLYRSKDEEDWKQVTKELNTVYQMEEVGEQLYCIGLDENQKPIFAELTQKLDINKMFVSLSDVSSFPKFLEFSHSSTSTFWLAMDRTAIRFSYNSSGIDQLNIQQSTYENFHVSDIEHIAAVNDTMCWVSANNGNILYRLTLLQNNPKPKEITDIVVDNKVIEKGVNTEIAILFKSESWELDNSSRNRGIVADIKKALEADKSLTLKIEGHTGYFDDKEKAQTVSYNRAKTIKQEILMDSAIDEGRISIEGFGNTRPKNKKRPNAPENKRVEVRFEVR